MTSDDGNSGEESLDSYTLGTPSSGGAVKVYFNIDKAMTDATYKQRIYDMVDFAQDLHIKAKKRLQLLGG